MPDPPPAEPDPDRRDGIPVLSTREMEALRLLAAGRSTAEIAAAMAISSNTVRTHIHRLGAKLHVTDRQQVVPRARSLGLALTETPQGSRLDHPAAGSVPGMEDQYPTDRPWSR